MIRSAILAFSLATFGLFGGASAQMERGQTPATAQAKAQAKVNPPDWNARSAWLVWKTMEPEATARCADVSCPTWQGGFGTHRADPAALHGRVTSASLGSGNSINYLFKGCQPDKTGCKSLQLFFGTTNAVTAEAVDQFKSSGSPCQVDAMISLGLVGNVRLFVDVPLSASTSLASLEAAKTQVVNCGMQLMGR